MDKSDRLPRFGEFPTTDPVTELLIQPSVYQAGETPYLPNEVRPPVNTKVIDSFVNSAAFFKRSKVMRHAREEWDRHLKGKVSEMQATLQNATAGVPRLMRRVRYHNILALVSGSFETLRRWTTGSANKLRIFQLAGWMLLITSFVGTFKLLSLQAAFADSPISCGILATLAALAIVAAKGMIEKVDSPVLRRRLRIGLNALSLVLLLTYGGLVSFQTGGLAAGILDVLELGRGETSFGMPWLSPYLQTCQLWLESITALACFENAEALRERFGEPNETKSATKELRLQQSYVLEQSLKAHHDTIAWARGTLLRLKADRAAYVLEALAYFEEQAESRRVHRAGMNRARRDGEPRRPFLRRCADVFRS
jgi:hypothetical protein